MVYSRYLLQRKDRMSPYYTTYEEYLDYDKEYRVYEDRIEYLTKKYMTSIDRDDMEYPPSEYWESGL